MQSPRGAATAFFAPPGRGRSQSDVVGASVVVGSGQQVQSQRALAEGRANVIAGGAGGENKYYYFDAEKNQYVLKSKTNPEKSSIMVSPVSHVESQEAKNRRNIPSQEKFHTGILRGLRNISDTP